MHEEITATVQLIYSCPAAQSLSAQTDLIHTDITRLMDAHGSAGVQLVGLTVQHAQSEVMTYGEPEPRAAQQGAHEEMKELLARAYPDAESYGDALMFALCDLRHLADQQNLAFGLWDKNAYRIYRVELEDAQRKKRQAALACLQTGQGESS